MTGTDVFYGLGLLIVFLASPKDLSRFSLVLNTEIMLTLSKMYTNKVYLKCHKLEWGYWRLQQSRINFKSSKEREMLDK